jgi:CRISPR-associated endonuclease/helicase Cas3
LTAWPGKSAAQEGGQEHPAACHMLDVAAVAEVLLATTDPALPPGSYAGIWVMAV